MQRQGKILQKPLFVFPPRVTPKEFISSIELRAIFSCSGSPPIARFSPGKIVPLELIG